MELSSAWWKASRCTHRLKNNLPIELVSQANAMTRCPAFRKMRKRLVNSNDETVQSNSLTVRTALLLLLLLAAGVTVRGQVRVWEGTLKLPVYEEGSPDPNPPFDEYATNRFSYPYPLRREITSRRVEHELRAIYLENEYLKCSVLPDIGGHLYTCVDKISGLPMFYANPSIKKANIGYRGAWAAFGVEFNFPVST